MKYLSKLITPFLLFLVALFWSVDGTAQLHKQANLDYLTSISAKTTLNEPEKAKIRQTMLAIMNEARANPNYRKQSGSTTALNLPSNLKPLMLDDRLNRLAQIQADYQASIKSTTHDNRIAGSMETRTKTVFGKDMAMLEACGSSTNMADYPIGWMKSETHYRPTWNLDPGLKPTAVGFGFAKGSDGQWYHTACWTDVTDYEALKVDKIKEDNKNNLAFGKPARQSSNYQPSYGANKAVDGETKGDIMNIAATSGDQFAWWEVDLGADYTIDRVVVWNRTDCCWERLQNFTLLVSSSPITNNDVPGNEGKYGPLKPWTASMKSYSVPVNRKGRYVRIKADGNNGLAVAEVQVFGKATSQTTNADPFSAKPATASTKSPSPQADPFAANSAASTAATLKYTTRMNPGQNLLEGEKLVSPRGLFQLRGTNDGTFVIEEVKNGRVVYTFPLTGPIGNPPSRSVLSYNRDSNICIQSKQNKGYCVTNGSDGLASVILNKSDHAELTDNGQLMLVNNKGDIIWQTSQRILPTN